MNCTTYIFGKLSSGYTQYPEDSSVHLLSNIYSLCKATTQIIIRREENLMYYCYLRKLTGGQYIGFSIVVNGFYAESVGNLFSIFEDAIERIAVQGSFIHYNEDGSFASSVATLKNEEEEIDAISADLCKDFVETIHFGKLPHINYGVAKDSKKAFSIEDSEKEMILSSYTYGYTSIYKDQDFNTVKINRYQAVLSRLKVENRNLKQKNTELQNANLKILRQKKQFRNVILLLIIVMCCGIGLYFLYQNLGDTQMQLEQANANITEQAASINQKNTTISNQKASISSLKQSYDNAVAEKETLQAELRTIIGLQPLLFHESSFNFSTGYLKIKYYGLTEGSYNIIIRVISPDGSSFLDYPKSININSGENEVSVYINSALNANRFYYFAVIYDNKIIGGDRH